MRKASSASIPTGWPAGHPIAGAGVCALGVPAVEVVVEVVELIVGVVVELTVDVVVDEVEVVGAESAPGLAAEAVASAHVSGATKENLAVADLCVRAEDR